MYKRQEWLLNEIIYNDRLDISKDLVIKLHNDPKSTKAHQELAKRLAKICVVTIPKGKYSNDAIKERFGCECQYCQKIYRKDELQIDHIVPQSTRHQDIEKPWNKVPACIECNNLKSNKNVFVFLSESGFDLSNGVKSAVDRWVKRNVLKYPSKYGDKRNIKEKTYTWNQVTTWVSNNPDLKASDYECINPESEVKDRRWITKKLNNL